MEIDEKMSNSRSPSRPAHAPVSCEPHLRMRVRQGLAMFALLALVGLASHGNAADVSATPDAACPALLQHTFNRLQTGQPQSLCQFQGKVLLVVNTASYCGYTHQYEGLEAMYRKYKDRGLVIVGFPSNDFSQEPGSNKEVAEFCRTTYGVDFPQFEKSSVAHLSANPLYAALAKQTGKKPQWNFYKFVVDRSGKPVATFPSATAPDNPELTTLIEKLLAERPGIAKG
jgi:glutathione peroxidase